MKQCPRCQSYCDDYARFCNNCGYDFSSNSSSPRVTPPPVNEPNQDRNNPFDACGPEGKSRGVAALLAIFLGVFGVQYFYMGKNTAGIISIILALCSCGIWEIVTFIQGVLMIFMTNDQFRQKYITSTSTFPLF